jgi:AsmA protein
MGRSARFVLIAIGAVVALVVIVAICLPLFLNADSFRTRIESTLTKSLGRKVTIGKLNLSVWSGGLVAENASVADDPAFSTQPFIQADSVKIGVEMLPLLLSKQVHIRGFSLISPKVQLLRAANGTWNYSSIGAAAAKPAAQDEETKQTFPDLTVGHVIVKNGRFTVGSQPGAGGVASAPARTYDQVNLDVKDFGFKNSFPFTVSANLPGDGKVSVTGTAGPVNQQDASATPVDAQVTLKHVDLATAGVLPPDAGIGGTADLQAKVQSNGQTLNATGSTQITGIKLAKDGQPSAKPVQLQFAIAQNEQAMTGQVQHATFTVGRATINMDGTYQTSGPTTAINLKVNGDGVPIDELVAFLPALGVRLPQGSALKGGTLTTALTVSGSSANPVISGPVRLNNTQLAGFDLGSKLQTLSQLTGGKMGSATGSGTNIRSLSMNIREAGGAIQTDNIALDVAGVGTATGAGNVSAAGALNYNMVLKLTGLVAGSPASNTAAPAGGGGNAALLGGLAGMIPGGGAAGGLGSLGGLAGAALKNGIPVAIGGTTSNPTFAPNMRGLASGIGAGALNGKTNGKQNGKQNNPLGNALGGLLSH